MALQVPNRLGIAFVIEQTDTLPAGRLFLT
jgi:hypothetical protein